MIEVVCDGIRPAHVLELAAQFEAVFHEDIKLEVAVSGTQVTARAGGAVFSACDEVASRAAKLAAYRALRAATGVSLDWGCLTGVKPLKLMQKMITDGLPYDRACEEMRLKYELGPNKCALLRETAENQRGLLFPQGCTAALYLNIPLCPTKCAYCSFPSSVTSEGGALAARYVDALLYELENVDSYAKSAGFRYDSVYIGGGTPSILSASQIKRLLRDVGGYAPGAPERTFEAGRCDTLDAEKLSAIREGGISRISLNPQTMHDATLAALGRTSYRSDFYATYALARGIGFSDINCDLIFGFAGETEDDMMQSVREVAALAPESISLHALCKKRTSDMSKGDVYETRADVSGLQDRARMLLKEAGYAPYYLYRQKYAAGFAENVGYAKNGAACVYNIRMMGETQTVFSAGAHATTKLYFKDKDAFMSVFMLRDISLYIDDIQRLTQKKLARMRSAASCGRL